MPPLPPISQVVKIRFIGTTQGAPFIAVMHAQFVGSASLQADMDTLATNIRGAYSSNFATMLSTLSQVNSTEVTDLSSSTGLQSTNTSVITGTGGTPTNLPRSACGVVSWHQTLHYRGGHPRTYFPLRTGSDLLNSFQLNSTYTAALQTAARSFITSMNAVSAGAITAILFGMVSYRHGNAPRPTPLFFPITTATVHSRLDSQRRRLGKEF